MFPGLPPPFLQTGQWEGLGTRLVAHYFYLTHSDLLTIKLIAVSKTLLTFVVEVMVYSYMYHFTIVHLSDLGSGNITALFSTVWVSDAPSLALTNLSNTHVYGSGL